MFLLIPPVVILFLVLSGKKHIVSCSNCYIVHMGATFCFVSDISFFHELYIISCIISACLGAMIFSRYRLKLIKTKYLFAILNIVFVILFLYYFIVSWDKLNIESALSIGFHLGRSEVSLSYFEYLFTRTLFIFPAIFLIVWLKNPIVVAVICIMAIAVSLNSLQKSPMLFFMLSLVVWKLVNNSVDGQLKFSQFTLRFMFVFVFVIIITVFISWVFYRSNIFFTLEAILTRIFILPAEVAYSSLRLSESYSPFLGGASFSSVFKALGLPYISLGKENFLLYFGFSASNGTANSPSITSIYADFRFFGLILVVLISGLLRVYDNTIIRALRNTTTGHRRYLSAFYAVTIVITLKLNITALGTALLSEALVASLMITYVFAGGQLLKLRWR